MLFNMPYVPAEFGIACRPERQDECRAGVGRAIDYARALGVRQVNVISGRVREGDDRAELRRTLVENLRFAAREVARRVAPAERSLLAPAAAAAMDLVL